MTRQQVSLLESLTNKQLYVYEDINSHFTIVTILTTSRHLILHLNEL